MSLDLVGPFSAQIGDYPDTEAELDTPLLIGVLLGVALRYTFDGGTALDVDIVTNGAACLAQDLLHLSGANTDAWYHPTAQICDTNGGTIASQYNIGIPVYDTVHIAVSNGGENDRLDVWFLLEN